MKTNRQLRAALLVIPVLLSRLRQLDPAFAAKDSAYSLLQSYGVLDFKQVLPLVGKDELNRITNDVGADVGDEPLSFLEWTRYDTWFRAHPEKVAGKQVITTSMQFPVTIEGSKADIIQTIRNGMQQRPTPAAAATNLDFMKLKAKAVLVAQQQARARKAALRGTPKTYPLPKPVVHVVYDLGGLGRLTTDELNARRQAKKKRREEEAIDAETQFLPEIIVRVKKSTSKRLPANFRVSKPGDCNELFRRLYGRDTLAHKERMYVIYLDRKNAPIGYMMDTVGTRVMVPSDVQNVLAVGLKIGAESFAVCHNHPSGNMQPSQADIDLTKSLFNAAYAVNLNLLEHIIVSQEGGYYSFMEKGFIQDLHQAARRRSGIAGIPGKKKDLGFLGTLGGLSGLAGLGKLPDPTSETIEKNKDAINALLDQQDKKRKYKKGDTLSFDDIVAQYNPGISADELKAWVWYKRSIGVPMTGWNKYYLTDQKVKEERIVSARPNDQGGKGVIIRDNHFREIGKTFPGSVIGVATKKTLQYDANTRYLIVRVTNDQIENVEKGSLVYLDEKDCIVDKPADNVDSPALKKLILDGYLFYCNGRLQPYPVYAYGNMYDKELQLNRDEDYIREKWGETVVLTHRTVIQRAKPRLISIQNADSRERPKILVISDFAERFYVTGLREDSGIDLQKLAKEKTTLGYRATKAEKAAADAMMSRMSPDGSFEFTLPEAFMLWLNTLPKGDFKQVSAYQIAYYYIQGHNLGSNMSDEEKDTISKYAPMEGEELFSRFLYECLTYEDQQKLDFSWNRVYNAYASVPFHRVPVGFKASAFFKRSLLEFTPAQREAIAFMEIVGSGTIAYDVGVGKTMSAIITLANSMFSGKCQRPLLAVPNPTYAKWLREIVGYEDSSSGEFVPGVLSFTGVTINDWTNLGVSARKGVDFEKTVPANSITVVTYEGLMQIGYGKKVMEGLFDELVKVLYQNKHDEKSAREKAKLEQRWREMIGVGNMGTLCDVDRLGFDYLVIDEAHNFKNIFDQVPTDSEGKKRFKISGSQSNRGIKAFFLCNYIQRTFGQNVMLLTATPFTNSPLEIYSMLSLIGYDSLKAMGITSLEIFCETFILQSLEYVNDYKGDIKLDYVVKSFNNRLVLQRLIHNHIAYKTGEEAGVKRPVKINLPRTSAQQADGSQQKLPNDQRIVTYLRPTQNQIDNQAEIERLAASAGGGPGALATIGRALGQNLDNALSPYLYKNNADTEPTYDEFVENSPKIAYAVACIESVKKWHEARKEPVSGQVIYMNRGKQFFPLIKEYLEKIVGYKTKVSYDGGKFNEVEILTSEITPERKEAIKDAFLAGVVKIIIGTATIREGIDLQVKGTVIYNLFPDWNPTDLKQLEGRIWRQGNEFGYVRVVMPLVQDTMDVFVFQKLEEKTSRINDIWYRADRGNVLDNESLDPAEIKFALYSDIMALVGVKLDQIKKELKRRYAVVQGNIEALGKFSIALSSFFSYQRALRQYIKNQINGNDAYSVGTWLRDWDYNEGRGWYLSSQSYVRLMSADKRKELRADLQLWQEDAQAFDSSADQNDKDLIRLFDRWAKLNTKYHGAQGFHHRYEADVSEFRQRLSEVRKTERTALTPRGLTINDDLSSLMADYQSEKKEIEAEASVTSSPEFQAKVADEIRETKARNAIGGGSVEQRAEDFARLNYLLGYKAADVAADAYGLPNEHAAQAEPAPSEAPKADQQADAEWAHKLKLLKLKAKAALVILEQQAARKRKYAQAA